MTKEQLRMQMLSGIITEGEYKSKLNEDKSIDDQISDLEKQLELLKKQRSTRQNTDKGTGLKFGPIKISPQGFEKLKKSILKVYNRDYDEAEAWENGYVELVKILKKENPELNARLTQWEKENGPEVAGIHYYEEIAEYYGYDSEDEFNLDIEQEMMPKIIDNYG